MAYSTQVGAIMSVIEATMNRSRALALLRHSKPTLMERYGVTRLALFGSTARNAAQSDSDSDILVVAIRERGGAQCQLRS